MRHSSNMTRPPARKVCAVQLEVEDEVWVERQTIPAPHEWEFYIAYNLFRGSGITQGIMKRALKGTASSEHAVEMAIAHEKSPTSRGRELKSYSDNR
jgi:aminoglycoside phosphotransferase (APT) family kinase protein